METIGRLQDPLLDIVIVQHQSDQATDQETIDDPENRSQIHDDHPDLLSCKVSHDGVDPGKSDYHVWKKLDKPRKTVTLHDRDEATIRGFWLMGTFISYIRVSTDKQARSGLGLEAQETAIRRYLEGCGGTLLEEYREAESGKRSDRPELRKALDRCKELGATLLIAKLDRLARNVHFISGLMESGVDFVACDMPTKNRFMLHVYAAMGEEEGRLISERTRAGLAERRRKGLPLGSAARVGPMTAAMEAAWFRCMETRRTQMAEVAREFLDLVGKQVQTLYSEGWTLQQVADRMNNQGYRTARGARWTRVQVMRVLRQLGVDTSRGRMERASAGRELARKIHESGGGIHDIVRAFGEEGLRNANGDPYQSEGVREALRDEGIKPTWKSSRGFVLSKSQRNMIRRRVAKLSGVKP
jgi:DNA invertase Pin-like site-specific DNA recombinase